MKPFTTISSRVIPLPLNDVDTDLIIPAQFLTSTSSEGYGHTLFRRLRDSDPKFPLNLPEYSNASILLAASNFGCGSSREHAVWAITGAGISVVIAESFADIFAGNSAKNGLLLITLPKNTISELHKKAATGPLNLTVDLNAQKVTGAGIDAAFKYDPFRKHCLLNGLEDLDYLLSHKDEITKFHAAREKELFFSTLTPNR